MPDPQRLLNTLRRATFSCRQTPGRQGGIVSLQDCDDVIIAGDMHGNVNNFRKLLQAADLAKHARRHLILQELIHGPFRYPLGGDSSHQLLDLFAALKCQYPNRVHALAGNHEVAQWTGQFIMKGTEDVLALFDQGIDQAYAPHADEVRAAYDDLFAVLPLVCRTANGVFMSHSLAAHLDRTPFDLSRLQKEPIPSAEYGSGGSAHALLWGRDVSEDNVNAFLKCVAAELLITGHIPCERGYATPNSRQLILDAEDTPACYCLFRADRTVTMRELVAGVGNL
jgi:hypothetical protein